MLLQTRKIDKHYVGVNKCDANIKDIGEINNVKIVLKISKKHSGHRASSFGTLLYP